MGRATAVRRLALRSCLAARRTRSLSCARVGNGDRRGRRVRGPRRFQAVHWDQAGMPDVRADAWIICLCAGRTPLRSLGLSGWRRLRWRGVNWFISAVLPCPLPALRRRLARGLAIRRSASGRQGSRRPHSFLHCKEWQHPVAILFLLRASMPWWPDSLATPRRSTLKAPCGGNAPRAGLRSTLRPTLANRPGWTIPSPPLRVSPSPLSAAARSLPWPGASPLCRRMLSRPGGLFRG